jgi:hypothetical protein
MFLLSLATLALLNLQPAYNTIQRTEPGDDLQPGPHIHRLQGSTTPLQRQPDFVLQGTGTPQNIVIFEDMSVGKGY